MISPLNRELGNWIAFSFHLFSLEAYSAVTAAVHILSKVKQKNGIYLLNHVYLFLLMFSLEAHTHFSPHPSIHLSCEWRRREMELAMNF